MTLIEEFYEENKHKYSDIPLSEFTSICNSPFKFIREVINRGLLKNIRLQYFGVFEVMPSRVKYSLQSLENNYTKGVVSEKRYKERKEILSNYDTSNRL